MRKNFSAIGVIALLLLLTMSEAVSFVSANPWAFSKAQIDPPSSAKPPTISVSSPQNGKTYSGTFNISLSVNAIKYSDYFSDIYDITLAIDNQNIAVPHGAENLGLPQYSASFLAPNLTGGNHTLTVKATGITYKPMGEYFIVNSSSQVNFVTLGNGSPASPTPDATSSQSMPTNNTGPQLPAGLNPPTISIILTVMIAIAVASVVLVYCKRRKRS